jgi:beta-galactosidase
VPKFELTEFAPMMTALTKPVNGTPKTFEEMDMGWGTMMYSTRLPEITSQSVLTGEFHDFAQVFIDKKYIGKIDRVKNEKSLTIPAVKKGAELIIIVEGMGRINFGRAIKDFKGIVGNVTLTSETDNIEMTLTPKQWQNVAIPDDYETAVKALDMVKGINDQVAAGKVKGSVPALALTQGYEESKKQSDILKPGYHRGYFTLKKVGDTFLNFETWGKGQVWVNGHAMGRIWSIGPQQTLYVPGCWLKKGKNEIIVLDVVGPKQPVVWGQDKPELNKLQLEKSNKHNNIGDKPDLNSQTPVATGSFKAGNGWQTIKLDGQKKGRYLAIECLSTQKDGDRVAIAELYLQGANGQRLSREPWTAKYANSEEENGNHTLDKVFDLQESTYWQTEKSAQAPHLMVIDLGQEHTVSALEYLPRAEQGAPGSVKNFKVYLLK